MVPPSPERLTGVGARPRFPFARDGDLYYPWKPLENWDKVSLVCRQIYIEARLLLFKLNDFLLDSHIAFHDLI
jgi:hypothetical protein